MNDLQLFQANKAHHAAILQLWEDSIQQTHHFLAQADIQFYKKQLTESLLHEVNLFCLQAPSGELLGFMGIKQISLEMLFIHPRYMRKGLGKALVQTAKQSFGISKVNVNEQNFHALAFYKACGFEVVGRSEHDGSGRPYPIIHLEISSAQAAIFVDWNNYADTWENTPGVKNFSQACFNDLKQRFHLQGLRILDFGCGTGLLSEHLSKAGAEVVAVDLSTRMIEILNSKQIPHVQSLVSELHAADIYNQHLLQEKFDMIVASSVMAFIPNQLEKLKQLKSLLKPMGQLVQWDWEKVENQADFGFTINELEELYTQAEFKHTTVRQSFSINSENGSFNALIALAQK